MYDYNEPLLQSQMLAGRELQDMVSMTVPSTSKDLLGTSVPSTSKNLLQISSKSKLLTIF